MKIAIVGSGAAGLASSWALESTHHSYDLISPSRDVRSDSAFGETYKPRNVAKKSLFGLLTMYEYPDQYVENPDNLDIPLSGSFGGLTTVWGANVWIPQASEFEEMVALFVPCFDNYKSEILRRVPLFSNLPIETSNQKQTNEGISRRILQINESVSKIDKSFGGRFSQSILAVNPDKCIRCNECLIGCRQEAIFSADLEWKKKASNKFHYIDGFVEKLENKDEKVVLHILGKNGTQKLEYDRVFIGAGAIATSALLQRSIADSEQISLSDTQVFYLPFFDFRLRGKKNSGITLSQSFYRWNQNRKSIHISIYESNEEYRRRLSGILRLVSQVVPGRVWSNLLAGIGFVESDISSSLQIRSNGESSRVTFSGQAFLRSRLLVFFRLLRIIPKFLDQGLLPLLPLMKFGNPGASYHVGNLQINDKDSINTDGSLSSMKNVFIIDSSSLKVLPVGPITFAMMINSYRITWEAINE